MLLKRYFWRYIMLGDSCLNKLDTTTRQIKRFSNPQALSSTLAALGILQPWTFRLLNHLIILILASNYYLVFSTSYLILHLSNFRAMQWYGRLTLLSQLATDLRTIAIHQKLSQHIWKLHAIFKPGARRPVAGAHLVSWNCFCADVCMCVFVCPPPRLLITSAVMWRDMDSI